MADELVIQGKTVKMTFGRLNYVAGKVGDLSEIGAIFVVPEAQDRIIRAFLAKYKTEDGTKFYDSEDTIVDIDELESSDAIRILDFAEEHLNDFFMEALKKVDEKAKRRKAQTNSSPNTTDGQKN